MSNKITLKLLCLGDSAVGKSNLLAQYTEKKFVNDYISTIGVDFKLKTLQIGGRTVRVQLWDTAGQERFRTIAQAYFRGAHGVLLVYDVTNERSFANVRRWADDVDRQTALSDGGGGSSVLKIVVGNKCDLAAERVVDAARGSALAAELGVRFFETSAKTGASVDEAFQTLITDVFERAYGVGGAAAPKTVGGIVKLAAAQLKNAGGAHDVSASAAGGNINSSSSGSSSSGGGASPSKSDSACCT